MTQKEAVQEFLCNIDMPVMRKMFISDWLEDINWHVENAKFVDTWSELEYVTIAEMQNVDYLLRPYEYAKSFIKDYKATPETALLADNIKNGELGMAGGQLQDVKRLYKDMVRAKKLQYALPYLYGWGIENTGWNSKGTGDEFVAELLEMINN